MVVKIIIFQDESTTYIHSNHDLQIMNFSRDSAYDTDPDNTIIIENEQWELADIFTADPCNNFNEIWENGKKFVKDRKKMIKQQAHKQLKIKIHEAESTLESLKREKSML